ncbi:carbohydrate-binding module family 48 protein [Glonium stellatum]|uniref:Carbohydrate-binding module family 48 protein n=1 Tax=Glonium stellatum TaxID=574774 RepID=A0A8E2F3P7_9PEZI|nr:carbohydrate-binding module family 48 protein [Glonium stellatum]
MGSYTFRWEHPANEVFVTGTFDDWAKSIQLEKKDDVFTKTVELPKEKVQYKFVVDGKWVTNDTAPGEEDGHNNYNNILLPDDIKEQPAQTFSSVTPESTTTALAGAVPKSQSNDSIPGAFPETPATEPQTLSINPLPATDGPGNPIHLAPGEKVPDPSTFTDNTIESTVKDDPSLGEEEKPFGVDPIPATAGAGNPIHLAPGEPVPDPSTITSNTISSTVRTDAGSYENADSIPPQLGPVITPEAEREANGGMFGLPPISKNMIPESSLPMGPTGEIEKDPGVTIQSAAPISSTAALAALVPKEPRGVPEIVTESQKEANFEPEAAASAEAVQEKNEVEKELLKEVPEQPAAAESSSSTGELAETLTGGAAITGATFAGATYAAKEKAAELTGLNGPNVPEVVTESQKEADANPEASANPEAVAEKAAMESELLKEVKTTKEASEPAPTVTAEASEVAPTLSPDALSGNGPLKSSSEPEALNAPAEKAAAPAVADSRDISPMSKQPTTVQQTAPTVTTGVETSTTEAKTTPTPETPNKGHERSASQAIKGTPDSVGSGASQDTNGKKKKRFSFLNKLKGKFHHS